MKSGSCALLILLANSGSRCRLGHERLESRSPGLGRAISTSPRAHSNNMDRRSRDDVLAMGCRCTPIAGTSDTKGAHGLGDRPLHPGSLGIFRLIGGGLLTLPSCLPAEMWCLRPHRDRPPGRTGAQGSARTRLTITPGALDGDHGLVAAGDRWSPTQAWSTPRTDGRCLGPITGQMTGVKSLSGLGLPCVIRSCRAEPLDAMRLRARPQERRIPGAGLDHLTAWPPRVRLHGVMDGPSHLRLRHGPSRRCHLGHEMGCLRLTALGDMPLVSHPRGGVLLSIVSREGIGRAEHAGCGGEPVGGSPPRHPGCRAIVWLDPSSVAGLDRGDLTSPRRGVLCRDRVEPRIAICAHGLRRGPALGLALGHVLRLHPGPIPFKPLRLALRVPPGGGDHGPRLERRPPRLGHPGHPIERSQSSSHLGGSRPLSPVRPPQLTVLAPLQPCLEEGLFGTPLHHARAKLAPYRAVEPRIGALHPQGLRPIDAATHGMDRLAVGPPLDVWQDGHQGQPPWCFCRSSTHRQQGRQGGSGAEGAKRLPHAPREAASGKRRAGDPSGLLGNGSDRLKASRHRGTPDEHARNRSHAYRRGQWRTCRQGPQRNLPAVSLLVNAS
jgi:hypothetical protein